VSGKEKRDSSLLLGFVKNDGKAKKKKQRRNRPEGRPLQKKKRKTVVREIQGVMKRMCQRMSTPAWTRADAKMELVLRQVQP